jgi:hypothetical protein
VEARRHRYSPRSRKAVLIPYYPWLGPDGGTRACPRGRSGLSFSQCRQSTTSTRQLNSIDVYSAVSGITRIDNIVIGIVLGELPFPMVFLISKYLRKTSWSLEYFRRSAFHLACSTIRSAFSSSRKLSARSGRALEWSSKRQLSEQRQHSLLRALCKQRLTMTCQLSLLVLCQMMSWYS